MSTTVWSGLVSSNSSGDSAGIANLSLLTTAMPVVLDPVNISDQDSASLNEWQVDDGSTDDFIHNQLVQIFFCILYTTVFVLGVFGNVLVCYVVLRNRAMQTVTNIFITNLALSDILLCVLAVPFTPLYTFMRRWAFGRTLCHLVSFAQGCSIYISTLTLTSIAIDRYFVIIYPFHPRMKLSTCIAIIISIWVISLLATLPYGMYMKVVSDSAVTIEATVTAATINSSDLLLEPTMSSWHGSPGFYASVTPTTGDASLVSASMSAAGSYMQIMAARVTNSSVSASTSAFTSMPMSSMSMSMSMSTTSTTAMAMATTMATATTKTTSTTATTNSGAAGANMSVTESYLTTAYCEENWPSEQYRKVFGSVTTILQFVLPFVIISICYTWVSVKLNARARAKPGTKSSRREEADRDRKKRTNRMLISMVAVFGLSWLPLNVVNIFDDFYEKSNEWRFYTLFFFVAHSIAMSSTCYNPFLYAWLNENFRKEFKHVLPCFNPSNNNIINITRGYNRSDKNTCGPRLHAAGDGGGEDENGITQESSLPRDKLLIIPREPTYGNGSGTVSGSGGTSGGSGGCIVVGVGSTVSRDNNGAKTISPRMTGSCLNAAMVHDRQVEVLLGADHHQKHTNRRRQRASDDDIDDIDSCDEQTVEMRFCETPFISSDNTIGISILETSTSIESNDRTALSGRSK